MLLGTQTPPRNDDDYRVLAQLGIKHICGWPEETHWEWTAETLSAYREKAESFGLSLDMIGLPMNPVLVGTERSEAEFSNIMLARDPERDREIEQVCNIIRGCAEAGIPAAKYNLQFLGVQRTERTEGRGGSSNSTFRWAEADQDAPPSIAGVVDADLFWERIEYFLERVIPVANEYKVRVACHPHDPRTPPGFMGVERVLGTVDGLRQFVQMHESPYHGLNFCQGTVTEMLDNPAEEIFDVIRWFGERKKIFLVHFRNIIGRKFDFVEVFPDEGDIDMLECARVYQEVGYPHMLVPDHVPQISGENPSGVAFAFCLGYMRAIFQAIGERGD